MIAAFEKIKDLEYFSFDDWHLGFWLNGDLALRHTVRGFDEKRWKKFDRFYSFTGEQNRLELLGYLGAKLKHVRSFEDHTLKFIGLPELTFINEFEQKTKFDEFVFKMLTNRLKAIPIYL